MGVYFGYLLAYSTGGWAADALGWRTTFLVVGLPGILVAALVAATVREPPRGLAEHGYDPAVALHEHASHSAPGFMETLGQLWSRRSFRFLALAGSLLGFLRYNFNPARIFLGDSGSTLLGFLLAWCFIALGSDLNETGRRVYMPMTAGLACLLMSRPVPGRPRRARGTPARPRSRTARVRPRSCRSPWRPLP